MEIACAKFARLRGGKGLFAEVAVEVESPSQSPGIEFRCCGRGFFRQGYVEDVTAIGYDDWKGGARSGATFALAVAKAQSARVVVTRISGLTTDTNPSVVGAAAALAVWRALAFEPSASVTEKVEEIVLSSWERPLNEVPDFTLS
jgi:hypothetical protein